MKGWVDYGPWEMERAGKRNATCIGCTVSAGMRQINYCLSLVNTGKRDYK